MKKLYRSNRDKKLCGVCGGLAEYLGIDSTIVRLIVIIFGFCTLGTALVAYLIAALVMPQDNGYTDV